MAKTSISAALSRDLDKYANSLCKNMAACVRDELAKAATSAITAFYEDYYPKQYDRIEDGLSGYDQRYRTRWFKKYQSKSKGGIYTGGIELSPEFLTGTHRSVNGDPFPNEYIYDWVWRGYHGSPHDANDPTSRFHVRRMPSPYPIEMVYEKHGELSNNLDKIQDIAHKQAMKASYEILSFK